MKAHAVTRIGLVREENQDACALRELPSLGGILAVVCDGMGGAAGGRVASEKAISLFAETAERTLSALALPPDPIEVQQAFSEAIYRANREVFDLAVITPELQGMGTTLTAALILPSTLYVANIGDSRAYLLHDRRLARLTRDDSYVQQLIDEGKMTEKQAGESRVRHLLTRALGTRPYTDFRFDTYTLFAGDRLLLCSDGLTCCVDDERIAALLSAAPDARTAANTLVAAAYGEGAPDNVTVAAISIE